MPFLRLPVNKKIKILAALKNELSRLRRSGKKIIFTNGCFDILHRGHVDYLKKAKGPEGILVVALNSDFSVRRLKGSGRPINNEKDRAEVLAGLESVDYVIIFHEDTPYNLIKAVHPDVLVKGGDWKKTEIVGSDIVVSYGGKVRTIKYVKGYSTTNIISKMGRRGGSRTAPTLCQRKII